MKVTIEVLDNVWVVQCGKEKKVFHLWHQLIAYLESCITSKGGKADG